MWSDRTFKRFGDSSSFALHARLVPDPDGDEAAPTASVGSWGQWRLWVNGENLAEHSLAVADGTVARQDAITWYLAPLFGWFAERWAPLLHEQRLPGPPGRALTARAAYLGALTTRFGDGTAFDPWQAWAERHALRTAAAGGFTPDVFLRRVGDDIEVSWGPRPQPGGDAVDFHLEPGVAQVAVADVAVALDAALAWFVAEPSLIGRPWHAHVRKHVEDRPREAAPVLPWYFDGAAAPGRLTARFQAAVETVGSTIDTSLFATRALHALSPAAAMFGAVSPDISDASAATLLGVLASARDPSNEPRALERHVEDLPASRNRYPWDDGYGLALDILDELQPEAEAGFVDVDALLARLGVQQRDEPLSERGPFGVALAMPGVVPTIVVNVDHSKNQGNAGRRFTLAHELCHLLFDRGRAKRIAMASTPWAPAAVEQRANAFAAMLLMPPALFRQHLPADGPVRAMDVGTAAKALKVGRKALIQHLANLGELTEDDRARLLAEFAQQNRRRVASRAAA